MAFQPDTERSEVQVSIKWPCIYRWTYTKTNRIVYRPLIWYVVAALLSYQAADLKGLASPTLTMI
jgi:hypothetical protein